MDNHRRYANHRNGKSQNSFLFLSILIVFSISQLRCSEQRTTEKTIDCSQNLQYFQPHTFDSLHIEFYYSKDAFSSIPFLSLSKNSEEKFLKGEIENIEETEFKSETRFDEVVEIPIRKRIYTFDKKNNLIKKETSLDKIETTTYEYNNRNFLAKETIDANLEHSLLSHTPTNKTKRITTFNYNNLGLLTERQCDDDIFEEHKLKYDSNNLRIQETLISYDQWKFKDSIFIKYSYFNRRLNEIILYNKEGERIHNSRVHHNEKENQIVISTLKRGLLGKITTINRISLSLDSACHPKIMTQVYRWGNENIYIKIELNGFGDMTSYVEYKRKVSPEEDLDFIDIDQQDDRSKFETVDFILYEYKYDNSGNWIERKDWDTFTRRIIKYKS